MAFRELGAHVTARNATEGVPYRRMACGNVDVIFRRLLSVRVPYTDLRGQQLIDAEARQLPKAGPGLICIATPFSKLSMYIAKENYAAKVGFFAYIFKI